jgi:hypothetical protein
VNARTAVVRVESSSRSRSVSETFTGVFLGELAPVFLNVEVARWSDIVGRWEHEAAR